MNVHTMVRPSLRVARVVYFTDVTRADAPIIPLGAFSELVLPHGHALALKARSSLKEEELAKVAGLIRERLKNPFDMLRQEFDLAWEQAKPGYAIAYLAQRNASALSILAPRDCVEKPRWYSFILEKPEAEAKIASAVNKEFSDLLHELAPTDPIAPDERTRIEVAAA
jgi:hypothetical protein